MNLKRRTLLLGTIGVLVVLLLLAIGTLLCIDPILKKVTESRIQAQTGLKAQIGQLKIKFASTSLNLKDLKILNAPDFGGSPLLDMPELLVELDPEQARLGKLRFKQIRVHLAELNVVKSKDGRLNVQALEKKSVLGSTNSPATGPAQPAEKRFEFAGIERMCLTLGKVKYTDLQQTNRNEVIDLGVQDEVVENIRTEEELKNWYGGFCVRLVLQTITQQMINGPERSQSFGELLKEFKQSISLHLN